MELPRTFGKYELLQLLGEGGMASVYRAAMSGPGGFRKQVALKLLKPEISEVEQMVELLFNEARLGGLLQHNNLVEVYEFDKTDGQYYMAIEFVDGYTLSEVMARRPVGHGLPPKIVAKLALQICKGLAYAHAAVDDRGQPMNLVHRDLKPANVMIRRDGIIKIADFGIAKAATNLSQTQTGLTRGTPVYMSPEQALGSPDKPIDRRSDLFSLASVLGEAITGELTFGGDQMLQVLNKVAAATVDPTLTRVAELAHPFVPVLRRAHAKDVKERYADAVEMGRHIRTVLDELPGPDLHLSSWLAAWMDEPEPTTLDQEIDPATSTSESLTPAPFVVPTPPPATPTPSPVSTIPVARNEAPPEPRLPSASRLSVNDDEGPASVPPSGPHRPINKPAVDPSRAASRPSIEEEAPPQPGLPYQRIQPGHLTRSAGPPAKKRSGFKAEHGVLIFAFVGLLFAVVYLSANNWKLPSTAGDSPPDLMEVGGPDGSEEAEAAAPPRNTRTEVAEPATTAPVAEAPLTTKPADLGLGEDIDGNARLQRCVKKHLRKHDTLDPVTVRYTVLADGNVEGTTLTSPDQVDPDLGKCLVGGMDKLRILGRDIDGPVIQTHVFRGEE